MHGSVLVLNQNYEPLDVCSIRRAVILVIDGKAEMLETLDAIVASPTRALPLPSVIRLVHLVRRPRPRIKLTRREVFLRDDYTCQYCGRDNVELTIDHVVPRSRGGGHTWENLVSACKICNHRKGGKSPAEARMPLRTTPHEPSPGAYYVIERSVFEAPTEGWQAYLPGMTMTPRSRRRSSSST